MKSSFATLALVLLAIPPSIVRGQSGDGGAFAISKGSTFSASSRAVEKKPGIEKSLGISKTTADVSELLDVIQKNHFSGNQLRADRLISLAIRSALGQLDPHSNYFTPDEFRELNDGHRSRYFGIGTTISNFMHRGSLETFVLAVGPHTPAARAGLRFGDRVVAVDGKSVAGMNSLDVRDLVRGPLNSRVKITVERADGTLYANVPMTRERVAERSVSRTLILEGSIGLISLNDGFDYSTFAEFDAAFRALKHRGMKSLVIDLRGNGGGLMDQAILIAEKFLPFGQGIVSQRGRYAAEDREWQSRNRNPEILPLVLLVDGGSASASEILAAAMQDNDRAMIVGERTFGKGLVQNIIPLEDGSGLTLTSERYFTPSGRTLQREYSDSGLYDYFRHTNQGVLIDKPEFAAKTRKGRTVFGGDGIKPDVIAHAFEENAVRLKLLDSLFNAMRNGRDTSTDEALIGICNSLDLKDTCHTELGYLRMNAAQLNSLRFGRTSKFAVDALLYDPQVEAAIRVLRPEK